MKKQRSFDSFASRSFSECTPFRELKPTKPVLAENVSNISQARVERVFSARTDGRDVESRRLTTSAASVAESRLEGAPGVSICLGDIEHSLPWEQACLGNIEHSHNYRRRKRVLSHRALHKIHRCDRAPFPRLTPRQGLQGVVPLRITDRASGKVRTS
jgi:hypothetical protein